MLVPPNINLMEALGGVRESGPRLPNELEVAEAFEKNLQV